MIAVAIYAQNPPGGYGPSGGGANGVGSTVNSAAPTMGFYLGPQCPITNTGSCVNTYGDTQVANDCGWTNASVHVICTNAHFSAVDVGKSVMGFNTCATDATSAQAGGGEIAPNAAMPTIIAFNSATDVSLSATPANTTAIHTGVAPIGGCFVWGHIDDAGFATLSTQVAAAKQCPKVFMSASYYLITFPPAFMTVQQNACINLGEQLGGPIGNPGFLAITLPIGLEVEGRGVGNTKIFMSTNFPNGDACSHIPNTGVTPFQNSGACFIIPVGGKWSDFSLTGGGQSAPTSMNNKTLGPYMSVGTLRNFTCDNMGPYEGNMVGIELSVLNQLDQVNSSGCGSTGVLVDAGAFANIAMRTVVESSSFSAVTINGATGGTAQTPSIICYWCDLAMANSQPFGGGFAVLNGGGVFKMIGGALLPDNGNSGANTNTGQIAYECNASGCLADFDATTFQFNIAGGASNNNTAMKCTAACTNLIRNSFIGSQASGFDYQDVTGSSLVDEGGNTWTPRLSIAGINHHSEVGTCTFAASTTCAVTFARTFGTQGTPTFTIPPNIVGAATTLTVSALSATGATITASASNSSSVNWAATQ